MPVELPVLPHFFNPSVQAACFSMGQFESSLSKRLKVSNFSRPHHPPTCIPLRKRSETTPVFKFALQVSILIAGLRISMQPLHCTAGASVSLHGISSALAWSPSLICPRPTCSAWHPAVRAKKLTDFHQKSENSEIRKIFDPAELGRFRRAPTLRARCPTWALHQLRGIMIA